MADNKRYQVAVIGTGWDGPGQEWLGNAIDRARTLLQRDGMEGPYHYRGHPQREYKRSEILADLKQKLANDNPAHDPYFVLPKSYDQAGVMLRVIKDTPDEASWVRVLRDLMTPCCRYGGLGAYPSMPCPTTGDCSGVVKFAVGKTTNIDLPHSANDIMNHPKVDTFENADNARNGDFVFYNFGRLHSGADDITTFLGNTNPGFQIGSRPSIKPGYSTSGVQIFSLAPEVSSRLRFGRLQV